MVKIVSRKLVKTQSVYDIGVERDHNFILANGLVASNCFNKSHSTAYAYVTYQTAYLKANYPAEYMAALLTANSDDQDKVQKYIANCQELGISVEGPDINRSEVDFTPSSEKNILFGLSAVKNVGEGAIQQILKVRKEGGTFTSLVDFCDRIDLHAVNSRALEALIKCGALDSIVTNRQQAIEYLPLVVTWAQKSKQSSLQPTLFDLSEVRSPAPTPPQVPDFQPKEKLQFEKELLGFYVSDHPLKYAEKVAKIQGIEVINLNQLGEQKGKKSVSAIVMLTEIKQVITKKGDPMAILQMEDLTGKAEAVVFPKTYDSVKSALVTDNPVIIQGKADKKENDDRYQIIVDEIKPIEPEQLAQVEQMAQSVEADARPTVMLELTPQRIHDEQLLSNLKTILEDYSGETDRERVPVIAIVTGEHNRQLVCFGQHSWVQDPEGVVSRLNDSGFTARVEKCKLG